MLYDSFKRLPNTEIFLDQQQLYIMSRKNIEKNSGFNELEYSDETQEQQDLDFSCTFPNSNAAFMSVPLLPVLLPQSSSNYNQLHSSNSMSNLNNIYNNNDCANEINLWNNKITSEIRNMRPENILLENGQDHYYTCQYIFNFAKLDKLLLGSEILNPTDHEVSYIDVGMTKESINDNDIYIRSGNFVKLIKTFFFEESNKCLLHKKYMDSNTYSKTLKLGVKLKYSDPTKRNVHYINLKGSLEVIRNELGKVDLRTMSPATFNPTVLGRNTSGTDYSVYTPDCSDEEMTTSGTTLSISNHGNYSNSSSHRKRRLPQTAGDINNILQQHQSNISNTLYNSSSILMEGEGLEYLEGDAGSIEGDICDVLNKLDLLKSQDIFH